MPDEMLVKDLTVLKMSCVHSMNPFKVDFFFCEEDWLLAHKGGILRPIVSLGQTIEMGEEIGAITDPFGSDSRTHASDPLKSIVGINSSPLSMRAPIKIASFIDDGAAESPLKPGIETIRQLY